MRVTLFTDLRFMTRPAPTGVDKHVIRMTSGLAASPHIDLSVLTARDQDTRQTPLACLPRRMLPLNWRAASAIWTLAGHPIADRWVGDTDWVYAPKNDWIPVRACRYAATVHGAPELDPLLPPPRTLTARAWTERNRIQYRRICRTADRVLTVSCFLKERIIDWFGCDPAKVSVVGNGVDDCFFAAGARRQPAVAVSDYVLCVGGLNSLDGGDRIVHLGRLLRTAAAPFRLHVAGTQHSEELRRQALETGMIDLIGHLSAPDLAAQMAGALALYYPTRYETFGLAAVEAMAAGTPVVTCRSTAIPEIAGDAAIYVDDPDSPADALVALTALANDFPMREQRVSAGLAAARTHTWPSCVQRLLGALRA